MKTILMTLLAVQMMAPIAFASPMGRESGGGDPCEDRIKSIRGDLSSWIQKGGANDLRLPRGLTLSSYVAGISSAIKSASIQCVGPGDLQYPVAINGTAKVCRFDKDSSFSQITCDAAKFRNLSESDQYMLIHHEYAGIAGIEKPLGDDSTYTVSNQITSYLVDQVVKRLAVKSVRPEPAPTKWSEVTGKSGAVTSQRLQDAVSRTEFIDCDTWKSDLQPDEQPRSCDGQPYYETRASFMPKPGNKKVVEQGWEKLPQLRDIVLNEKHGASGVFIGRFNCEGGDESRDAGWNQMYSGRTASGAETLRHQIYQFMVGTKNGDSKRVHLQATYQLDKKSQYVSSVEFRVGLYYKKNVGLSSNPKWVRDFVTIERFTCHGSN